MKIAGLLMFALLAACGVAGAQVEHKHAAPAHAPAHVTVKSAGVIAFDVYRDSGTLHLLTVESDLKADARALWYSKSTDGGDKWSRRVRVDGNGSSVWDLTRGNDAQIAASGERIVVAWTARGSGWQGSGQLVTAVSRDGGKTWRPGTNPADPGVGGGQSYAELIATKGTFDVVWLDGRDGAQGLRHARSSDGEHWSRNVTVQAKTCECCWQSLAQRDDTLLVQFRGKDPRDMVLSELPRGASGWSRRGVVGKFDWDFKGCPHTGGGLVVSPSAKTLHALSWTGATGSQGLHHLVSRDGGASWRDMRRLGSQDAQRGDLAISSDGKTLAAAWDQLEGTRRPIYVAQSHDEGATWTGPQRISAADAGAIYPRVVPTRHGFLVLWTESNADGASVLRMSPIATQHRPGK